MILRTGHPGDGDQKDATHPSNRKSETGALGWALRLPASFGPSQRFLWDSGNGRPEPLGHRGGGEAPVAVLDPQNAHGGDRTRDCVRMGEWYTHNPTWDLKQKQRVPGLDTVIAPSTGKSKNFRQPFLALQWQGSE